MIILNLTQHCATAEQIKEGVVDLPIEFQNQLKNLLTFEVPPFVEEMQQRAIQLASLIEKAGYSESTDAVMIGGAPFFMPVLQEILHNWYKYDVVYSFSKRISEEKVVDGKTIKTSVFKHAGFVWAF